MKQILFGLAAALVSTSAFAQDVCYTRAQEQAASMLSLDFGVARESIAIINVSDRKISNGGKMYRVQTLVNKEVPVEVKVRAFENVNGTCTTLSLEIGTAG